MYPYVARLQPHSKEALELFYARVVFLTPYSVKDHSGMKKGPILSDWVVYGEQPYRLEVQILFRIPVKKTISSKNTHFFSKFLGCF